MRTSVIVLAATPLLAVALASCSSSSSSSSTSEPVETPSASVQASENQAKVDAYCAEVDDVLAKANELKTNPNAQAAPSAPTRALRSPRPNATGSRQPGAGRDR